MLTERRKSIRRFAALTAGCGMLSLAVVTAPAEDAQSDNPDWNTSRQSRVDRQGAQSDDKGWFEQVRDWWTSDQGETQKLTGTIIDLETFLINGEEAARQQASSTAALHTNDPVALLTDDGEVYVILDRFERHSYGFDRSDMGMERSTPQPQTGTDLKNAREAADAADAASGPGAMSERPQTGRDLKYNTDQQSPNATGAQANRSADADMSRKHAGQDKPFQAQQWKTGQQVTLEGAVYERNGINGILIEGYDVGSAYSHLRDRSGMHDNAGMHDRAGASDQPQTPDRQDTAADQQANPR